MLKLLQKHAPTISILFLAILIVALFVHPPTVRLLSTIIIVFGIGTAILFTVHKNWEKHQNSEITRPEFIRNTALDLLGIALTMSAAIWLGRMLGDYAGQAVGMKASQGWGMIAGIAAGMVGGFAAAFVVGRVWGTVNNRLRVASATPKA